MMMRSALCGSHPSAVGFLVLVAENRRLTTFGCMFSDRYAKRSANIMQDEESKVKSKNKQREKKIAGERCNEPGCCVINKRKLKMLGLELFLSSPSLREAVTMATP